jgi:acetolactate synthase-1/2/3 large subunit
MTTQLAGHLIVECLAAQGATHAFGVPGESYLAVLDGFHAYADRIRFVVCRQEGGAAFMAEAHGKLTRRPGVCFVTRGPGATNASIGLHTAFQDSTPMVLLVGDVGSDFRDREAFQEVDFQTFFGPSTKGMAKRVERIDDARRIPEAIARAFATAMNGRPGPVVLVLPEDMLRKTVDAAPLPRVEAAEAAPTPEALPQLRDLLANAKRPFVIAGGSGWTPEAAIALEQFAEQWHLPVGNAFRFQDTFCNHHRLYAGDVGIGINPLLAARIRDDADLILAIGPRLGEMTTSGYTLLNAPLPRQKLIHIHAGAEELGRVYQPTLAINATLPAAARALAALASPAECAWQAWSDSAHRDYLVNLQPQALSGLDSNQPAAVDMPAVISALQRHLPPDAVLTNGAGNFASWLHRYFRFTGIAHGHKTQLAPTSGAMGYGVPAGIAAGIVSQGSNAGQRVVFTIAGDGDFLMNGQELATAAQYGARSIILLLDNAMFGTIRMHQEREYPAHDGENSGTRLKNPDFCALAVAYGYAAERVNDAPSFEAALIRALERSESGTLILMPLSPDIISTRTTLSSIRAKALASQETPTAP